MRSTPTLQKIVIETICLAYILLFVYAALSKLLDYESFTIQLGQSPLLSAFAGWISWMVPVAELLIALCLIVPRMRYAALVAAYLLMLMFSVYIFIILNYSEFVPCSCGGVLEKMSWQQHLAFNLVFCLLAIAGLAILYKQKQKDLSVKKIKKMLVVFIAANMLAIGMVIFLFVRSEAIMHSENNFIRRYPPHLYKETKRLDLTYPGYYFAGRQGDTLYLGNYNAPLVVLALDRLLNKTGEYKITLDRYDLPFRSVQLRIAAPDFYLADGTVPCIFKGNIANWQGRFIPGRKPFFTAFEAIDATKAVIRTKKPKNGESTLALLPLEAESRPQYNDKILRRQIDGVFDTDGMLHYNSELKKVIYLYYYRNQFSLSDNELGGIKRGNTIDTTSRAAIKIAELSNGDRKLSAPPHMVNNYSATSHDRLYVNSNLRGRFESDRIWKKTVVIDAYDLTNSNYAFSFYIYPDKGQKLQGMYAIGTDLYFLWGNSIILYQLTN